MAWPRLYILYSLQNESFVLLRFSYVPFQRSSVLQGRDPQNAMHERFYNFSAAVRSSQTSTVDVAARTVTEYLILRRTEAL